QQCNKYFGQSWSSSIANIISPCETAHTSSSVSSSSPPSQQYNQLNYFKLNIELRIDQSKLFGGSPEIQGKHNIREKEFF
ncbi:unnamed protein product, partial [Rotaria socialis]